MALKTQSQPTRILIGAAVRQEQQVFDAYWKSLKALKAPKNTALSFAFIKDDEQLVMPPGCDILSAPLRPADAVYAIDDVTHRWNVSTFEHLARCKQTLLDYATANKFDYIFLVDSDLLLEPMTLISLYSHQLDVVNGCFWTQWTPQDPPMPQSWLQHPYGMDGLGIRADEFINLLDRHQLVRVIGSGACTLIKLGNAALRYHPRMPLPSEGMWQGEDRSFAVRCQQAHVRQYCDAWPFIYHAYHPNMRTAKALDEAWIDLNIPLQMFAKVGDWINLRLTPMEDALLQDMIDPRVQAIRGRLGALALAPEIEEAIMTLQVGDKQIIDFTVQPGNLAYPVGTHKAIMVELIDARPHSN